MTQRRLAFDKGPSPRSAFVRARKAEAQYARQLRKLAKHIGDLVTGMWTPGDVGVAEQISEALHRYARVIEPWAHSVANRMLADVAARDRKAWKTVSAEMGHRLRHEIDTAPTGALMKQRLAEQVSLITSLPTDAAARVHKLTLEGITNGARASQIATEIMRSSDVSRARANLIARTEVSRTATALVEARAAHVGSKGYVWRTAHDSDVRESHRRMEGKFVAWDDPPTLDGMRGHAGALPNCRCHPEPVIPEF